MDIADKLFRIGLFGGGGFGGLGGCGGDSGFVVETIEVATCLLEFLDPFFGLNRAFGQPAEGCGSVKEPK